MCINIQRYLIRYFILFRIFSYVKTVTRMTRMARTLARMTRMARMVTRMTRWLAY